MLTKAPRRLTATRLLDTRVVEGDVQPAERLHRGLQRGLDVVAARDVAGHGERPAAPLLDHAGRLSVSLGCDVGDTTLAPSRANARAVARPIPRVAPVTNATFPLKRALMASP
jgi:hypothetical protein